MKYAPARTSIFIGCMLLAFVSESGWAQHAGSGAHPTPPQPSSAPPAAGPADAKVEFENESIIVVRVRMAPHEKTPMHDITSARLVVWLTDAHLRDTRPDGSANEQLCCWLSRIAEHSVEGCDHFSHDGDDDDLGFFVGGGEAFVEGLEGGTVTACAEGGHVEDVTDRHPTTIDAAVSLELAAVEVIWCEADEGGDLLAAHLPEFWQQGDEREGQHRADAWHRGQQLIALSESNIGGNHLGQALVEETDIGLQSHLAAFAEPPQHGIFEMSRLVLGC